jgi:uncharacterized membrane protein YjdF
MGRLDLLLHFLGGVVLAFFFFGAVRKAAALLGDLRPVTHYLLAFSLACNFAALWEIAEFTVDQLAGLRMQKGMHDTMGDLVAGALGAACALGLVAYFTRQAR